MTSATPAAIRVNKRKWERRHIRLEVATTTSRKYGDTYCVYVVQGPMYVIRGGSSDTLAGAVRSAHALWRGHLRLNRDRIAQGTP